MAVSYIIRPQFTKDTKKRSKRKETEKRKELETLISTATRAAHIARDKGFYIVSPEARQCVEALRQLRSLPLTPRLITKTDAFSSIRFLAKNGNPKIRSESRSVIDHWRVILEDKDK